MKKIALLTLLLINLSLSFSLPRNQASPAIFSVTQSAGTILFRHTDSTQTIIPCQSVASIVSNADPSKIVSVWVVQQGDYDKIMQFDYSVCGFSTKQEAVDSVTVWASCVYVNKQITARVDSTASSATPTINTDNVDTYKLTAQAADITSFTTNLTGTPTDDQILHIVIIGTATRAITWGSKFESSTVTLPTTTVSTNRLDVYFIWNTATSKWRCGGVW